VAQHSFWIIVDGQTPTSFKSRQREDLLPTLHQLQRKQPQVKLLWFERGRLWVSPTEAREALIVRRQATGRPRAWRPGGDHVDPRAKYEISRDQKRARFKARLGRDRTDDTPPADRERGPQSERPPAPRSQPTAAPGDRPPFRPSGKPSFRPAAKPSFRPAGKPPYRPAEGRPSTAERRPATRSADRHESRGEAKPVAPRKTSGFGDRPWRPKGPWRPKKGAK